MAPNDPHRHPSQEVDTDRVRKDAVKDYVFNKLVETMGEVKAWQTDIKDRLVQGSVQIDNLGRDIKLLRTDFNDHCTEEDQIRKASHSRWANLAPGLVASISSSLITAAIIGGLVMYLKG